MKNLFIVLCIFFNFVTFIEAGSESVPLTETTQGQFPNLLEAMMISNRNMGEEIRNDLLNPNKITVVVCGSNSPFPSVSDAENTPAQACTAVFVNGQFLLFDAGDGAERSLERLNFPMSDLSAVFITHFHNDHFADLGEVIDRSWTFERRHKLSVYGGVGITQIINGIKSSYEFDYAYRNEHHGKDFLPLEYVDVIPYPIEIGDGESIVVYEKEGVVVTAFDVNHPPVEPALGFTVTFGGKKIVISGDTTFTETLLQQSKDADVLVSDAMNKEMVAQMEAISSKNGWSYNETIFHDIQEYHIGVNELGQLAHSAGVKTLLLMHMIPSGNPNQMQTSFVDPISKYFDGEIIIAHDGSRVTIPTNPSYQYEIVKDYYKSGALRSEVSYVNGIKDGISRTWYENGTLKNETAWIMGSGRAKNYNENGIFIPFVIHPEYTGKEYCLKKARALIITTSVSTLGEDGAATGVFASEMTTPYYEFFDAGMDVDIASIEGGKIPIDPMSFAPGLISSYDQRYLADEVFLKKTNNSLKIDNIDFTDYDIVFLSGGWGAAYDLGFSEVLGKKITAAYRESIPLGAVCHGSLGFLRAKDKNGNPLVTGKRITGVTDKQVRELGIEITPQHPETELKAAGAIYESNTATLDILANYIVADGIIITGQNQNAGAEVAHELMALVAGNQGYTSIDNCNQSSSSFDFDNDQKLSLGDIIHGLKILSTQDNTPSDSQLLPVTPDGTGKQCKTDNDCSGNIANKCLKNGGEFGFCTHEGCKANECQEPYVCCHDCSNFVSSMLPFEGSACLPGGQVGQLTASPVSCTCD
ncbi:Beta-lactamase-like domain protein [Candidatus Magnetomorum sp. HK-1]|nr:Beta-lactamase-like domain protein [Candidatus Magnetomorum sp. HK-1]